MDGPSTTGRLAACAKKRSLTLRPDPPRCPPSRGRGRPCRGRPAGPRARPPAPRAPRGPVPVGRSPATSSGSIECKRTVRSPGRWLSLPELVFEQLGGVGQECLHSVEPLARVVELEESLRVERSDRSQRRGLERRPHGVVVEADASTGRPGSPSSASSAETRTSMRSDRSRSGIRRRHSPSSAHGRARRRPADTDRRGASACTRTALRRPTSRSSDRPASRAASTMRATVPTSKRASPPPTSLPRSISTTPNRPSPSQARLDQLRGSAARTRAAACTRVREQHGAEREHRHGRHAGTLIGHASVGARRRSARRARARPRPRSTRRARRRRLERRAASSKRPERPEQRRRSRARRRGSPGMRSRSRAAQTRRAGLAVRRSALQVGEHASRIAAGRPARGTRGGTDVARCDRREDARGSRRRRAPRRRGTGRRTSAVGSPTRKWPGIPTPCSASPLRRPTSIISTLSVIGMPEPAVEHVGRGTSCAGRRSRPRCPRSPRSSNRVRARAASRCRRRVGARARRAALEPARRRRRRVIVCRDQQHRLVEGDVDVGSLHELGEAPVRPRRYRTARRPVHSAA